MGLGKLKTGVMEFGLQ